MIECVGRTTQQQHSLVSTLRGQVQNTAARKPIYTAVFRPDYVAFRALTKHPAETIGRLNQKFFGRRAGTIVNSPLPQSRVFSKRFMRQMPDGTTQVQEVEQNG